MEIDNYLKGQAEIQKAIIDYLEENDIEEHFQLLLLLFDEYKIEEDKYKLIELLELINAISLNYHRSPDFFKKLEYLVIHFKDQIQENYSNFEIFQIFYRSKRFLLQLFECKIIYPEISQLNLIIKKSMRFDDYYVFYFCPEFESFFTDHFFLKYRIEFESIKKKYEKYDPKVFDEYRHSGENENHLCKLIRNDSIDEFISHVKKNDLDLSIKVEISYFETNHFLCNTFPTLIEYAAFFGSIQVFKYLYMNGIPLTPSIWLYAIHGSNPEMIRILEEKNIEPSDITYERCFIKSLECHHIEITNYLLNNYIAQDKDVTDSFFFPSLFFHNYSFFPNELNEFTPFFLLCKYNYPKIVDLLSKNKTVDYINSLAISFYFF